MDQPDHLNQGYFESDELRALGFKKVGANVKIAKSTTIVGPSNIVIGSNVRIDGCTVISAYSGSLTIGSYIHIGSHCFLACSGGIRLADFSGLSQGVRLYSVSDDYSGSFLTNPTVPRKYLNVKIAPVTLGKHVIVGSGSVVLPGVDIGEGSAVGALSLVSKSLGGWGIYFGAPAKRLKSRSRKLLALEQKLLSER
jgi:acetyltransferase-like isoleucine patch superfamily enzyme